MKPTHELRRDTDPVYPKERKEVVGTQFVLKYECICLALVPESAKQCPNCKRVNPDWMASRFGMKMRE